MKNVIEIKNLYKSFGEIKAVQDVSFSVEQGSLFAFLGVNGAGKSTTISMMCGQLDADRGEIFIEGEELSKNSAKIKNILGVVFQGSVLDKPLTVIENLQCRAALYGIVGKAFDDRIAELTKLLSMEDILKRPYGKLSGGQKRKADIARALLHKPKILILDEPTTGLDPQTRRTVWEVIAHLRRTENLTVFLTTHYMEEAADADRVVIIDGGRIVAEGTPIELKNRYTGDFVTLYGIDESRLKLLDMPFEKIGDAYKIKVENTAVANEMIIKHPEIFTDYEIVKGKMDDVFLAATGKTLGNDDDAENKKGGKKK